MESAHTWNKIWKRFPRFLSDRLLEFLWYFFQFRGYSKVLKGVEMIQPAILEIGAGSGLISRMLIDIYGGKVTLVDYSHEAIRFAQHIFRTNKYEVKFIKQNIFDVISTATYDLVHSQGLLEHFYSKEQHVLFKKHVAFVKPGGYLLLSVPREKLSYEVIIKIIKLTNKGKMPWGYEKGMTEKDLRELFLQEGLAVIALHRDFINLVMMGQKSNSRT